MSDIKTLIANPSRFGRVSQAVKQKQLKAAKYIELIANQARIPIETWDIQKIFAVKEGSKLIITNPKQINKILFESLEQNKEEKQKAAIREVLSKEVEIRRAVKRYIDVNVKNAENSVKYWKDRLSYNELNFRESGNPDYQRAANGCQESLKNAELTLDRVKKEDQTIIFIQAIARVVAAGFWKFQGIQGSKIKFITANDVVLFEKIPKHKINIHKNMGVYQCIIDAKTFVPIIFPFKGNTKSGHNIHPYIDSSSYAVRNRWTHSNICFGNAGTYFDKAKRDKDIFQVMNMVGIVLSTYSSNNGPYRLLNNFIDSDARKIEMTEEAKLYYAEQAKIKTNPVEDMLKNINTKEVANNLAKTIGKKKVVPTADTRNRYRYDEDGDIDPDGEFDADGNYIED